jgi:L-serine/L-threonine ammonia-lyase
MANNTLTKPWVTTPLIESRALSEAAKWYDSPTPALAIIYFPPNPPPISPISSQFHYTFSHPHLSSPNHLQQRVLNRRSRVFLKLENLQPAGSFKSRGIGNYILCRVAERKRQQQHQQSSSPPSTAIKIHFYAASGGNAGIACVHASKLLGYPATVVIPTCAKPAMVAKLWAMGATAVIQHGYSIAEAQEYVQNTLLPADRTGVFVPPFDHEDIWEGNASVMREISEQLAVESDGVGDGRPDVLVCSVGGGGLLNGIMQAIDEKGWNRDGDGVEVLAMETLGADSLNQSLRAGERVKLARITSQATSLGVVKVSEKTFEYAQRENVTSLVLSDQEAARGCCLLAEHERMMVELTVGVNVPVCYGGLLQRVLAARGKTLYRSSKVVIVVCGGNDISIDMLVAWRNAMLDEKSAQENVMGVEARPEEAKVAA